MQQYPTYNYRPLLLTLFGLSVIVTGLFAYFLFPVIDGDSIYFLPPARFYALGHGLINTFEPLAQITDPKHEMRYCFHLPLFPWFSGALAKIKMGFPDIGVGMLVCAISTLCLYYWKIGELLKAKSSFTVPEKLLLLFSSVNILLYVLANGRPEILSMPIITAYYLVYTGKQSYRIKTSALIILGGLLLATQLMGFLILMTMVAVDLFSRISPASKPVPLIRDLLALCVLPLLLGLCVVALSPNGLPDTIQGIRNHSKVLFARDDQSIGLTLHYWLFKPDKPLFGIIALLAAYYYGKSLLKRKQLQSVLGKLLMLGALLFLAFVVVFLVLRVGPLIYNAAQFAVVLILYTITNVLKDPIRNKKATYILLTAFVVGSLFYGRLFFLFTDTLRTQKDWISAQKEIATMDFHQQPLYFTGGLWSQLYPANPGVHIYEAREKLPSGSIVLFLQANRPLPLIITQNARMIYDWRVPDRRKFLGIPVSNRPYGYSFSVWRFN